MTNETLRMQMLSGIITEGEYKAIINKEIEDAEKASLNESMIGGIVGIGAINQIPPREKTDYELAFEHFLGERYETKFENREQDPHTMKEAKDLSFTFNYNTDEDDVAYIQRLLKQAGVDATAKAGIDSEEMVVKASNAIELRKAKKAISSDGFQIHENREQDPYMMEEEEVEEEDYGTNIVTGKKLPKPDPIVEEGLNENVGSTIDKMLQTFEFSEKGNDEMIEFGNYLLSPEGPKNIARSIKGKLKGEGGENYFTSKPEELDAFLSKL
jgi:hypothetical protein